MWGKVASVRETGEEQTTTTEHRSHPMLLSFRVDADTSSMIWGASRTRAYIMDLPTTIQSPARTIIVHILSAEVGDHTLLDSRSNI
jgi:hypothetical protein